MIYLKQMLWIVFGLFGLLLALSVNWGNLVRFSYGIYGLALSSLLLVALIGKTGMGARRWISLGLLSFQPSELMKIALVLALAKYLGEGGGQIQRAKQLLVPLSLIFLPVLLVLRQPDLGTAIVLFVTGLGMIIVSGLPWRFLFYSATSVLLGFPFLWTLLRDYQKERIISFLDPTRDPLGSGYHIIQSRIAVGSGKFLGKGWMAASQSRLNFLPEHHTDFIFAVSAEQFGFVGSLVILSLYLLLISRAFLIARQAKDLFSALLASGIVILFTFQVIVNVGMVTGLLPVVGIPLPLMSYGGTSMVTMMMAIGLLLSMRMRKYLY
jgi:rod shape determining protein RodA